MLVHIFEKKVSCVHEHWGDKGRKSRLKESQMQGLWNKIWDDYGLWSIRNQK